MKTQKAFSFLVIAIATMMICNHPITAQDEEELGGAEVNAYIVGEIPSIEGNWTTINLEVVDAFGIDWDKLSQSIPEWWMRLLWPLNPSFPQPVQRFLGYTGLRFEPEIIEGNDKGWFVRIVDNTVSETNPGDRHTIKVEARTDDSAIDYSVVIGIKTIRLDTEGGEIGYNYIRIPVKASPMNFVEMRTVGDTSRRTGLKSMVYFEIDVLNNGYYRDVFQFDLDCENDLLALVDQQALVLKPGETGRVRIGILTPERFFDPGTPNKVDVYVYSSGDPTKTLVGSLVVYTEGVYISPLIGIILLPIMLLVFLIFLFWYMKKTRKEQQLIVKPQKPWTIPEEMQHLEELRKKDKEAYEKEKEMMEQEYESAMLWYEHYKTYVLKQQKEEPSVHPSQQTLQKPEEPLEEQPIEDKPEEVPTLPPLQQPSEEQPDIIKKQYDAIQKKKQENLRRKQKAVEKIRKEQQRRQKKKT